MDDNYTEDLDIQDENQWQEPRLCQNSSTKKSEEDLYTWDNLPSWHPDYVEDQLDDELPSYWNLNRNWKPTISPPPTPPPEPGPPLNQYILDTYYNYPFEWGTTHDD